MAPPIEIVLLRHAPTAWNADKRLQGRSDPPLSPAGRALAASWRVDPLWRDWRIWSSPLRRARETAALLFPGLPIAIEPRLIEMDFGDWEGRRLADLRVEPGSDIAARERLGLDFRAPGGESPREVQARLRPWLAELAAQSGNHIAIAHKAVLRALYALASGWSMAEKPAIKFKDGHAQKFHLAAGGDLTLAAANLPLGEGGDR